ncbi:MAG: cytochrome C [Zoogloeaceae bacterium]|nr:cytochrome C [Rhodocyclaceae bacterium]MCP5234250.1 cytochrome C [Zoogloeaceae bacterium]
MKAVTALLALSLAAAAPAMASGGRERDDDERGRTAALDPTYVEECGACHVAYPPELLSRESWTAVVGRLGRHFGVDASLDTALSAEINVYLQAHAGVYPTDDREGQPRLRITETDWFRHEHRPGEDGLYRGVFDSEAVRSPANCNACHLGATWGRYGEDEIRIP